MNKLLPSLLVASAITTLPAISMADDTHGKRYAAIDIGFMTVEDESGSSTSEADITHVVGRVGGYLNDNLALEARLGTGVTDDSVDAGLAADVDVSLRYLVGAYLRAGAKVGDAAFPYVLLGFTRADVESEYLGNSDTKAETDVSYGVGVDVNLSGLTVAVEYANLVDKDDAVYSGFSIGLKSTF